MNTREATTTCEFRNTFESLEDSIIEDELGAHEANLTLVAGARHNCTSSLNTT